MTGAGAASPFTGTSIGIATAVSGITGHVAKTVYWVGGTGNYSDAADHWATSSGGAPGSVNYPLPQDTATFDANSFSTTGQTVTLDEPRIGAMDWSAVTNSPTLAFTTNYTMYGSVTFSPSMTKTGSFSLIRTIGNQSGTLDLNLGVAQISTSTLIQGLGFPTAININAPGGTVQLLGNFECEGSFTVTGGTFNANNYGLQYSTFISTGSSARTIEMGSGTWLSYSGGTVWNVASTGLTLTPNT